MCACLSYTEFEQVGIVTWTEYCSYLEHYFKFYNSKPLVSLGEEKKKKKPDRKEKSQVTKFSKIARLYLTSDVSEDALLKGRQKAFTFPFSFFWITAQLGRERFYYSC